MSLLRWLKKVFRKKQDTGPLAETRPLTEDEMRQLEETIDYYKREESSDGWGNI